MKITEANLKKLGFKKRDYGSAYKGQPTYFLKTHGIEFSVHKHTGHWLMMTEGGTHSATHIEELFGFLFQDGFKCGEEQKRKDILKVLGVKSAA